MAALGAGPGDLLRVRQVHGSSVRVVRRGADRATEGAAQPDGDALISNEPATVAAVQVADCVPLLMADVRSGAVAAVHAGWRGTLARVAATAVHTMAREFGTRSVDVIAALGPSIGPCCYDVGEEVVGAFLAAGASDEQMARWFVRSGAVVRLDLWAVNRDQLRDSGVASERIHLCRLCTKTHSQIFDSVRADGPNAGRMAGLIRVPRQAERAIDSRVDGR